MGCVAQKKRLDKEIYKMENQIRKLIEKNEEMSSQINTMREQEQQILQHCEQRNERQKIDLTGLDEELQNRFDKLQNELKQIDNMCEEQKQAKMKELLDWKNIFDQLDNISKHNLSNIEEEDEYA